MHRCDLRHFAGAGLRVSSAEFLIKGPGSMTARGQRKRAAGVDPSESAEEAGLRYVNDSMPGIRRRRAGKGFTYVDPNGRRVTDRATLARIRSLAVPPAYSDVWISQHPNGHIQATGRDARGRKQYRYHPRWREVRD